MVFLVIETCNFLVVFQLAALFFGVTELYYIHIVFNYLQLKALKIRVGMCSFMVINLSDAQIESKNFNVYASASSGQTVVAPAMFTIDLRIKVLKKSTVTILCKIKITCVLEETQNKGMTIE